MVRTAECRRKVLHDKISVELVVPHASGSDVEAGSVFCPLYLCIQSNLNLLCESGAVAGME